MRSDSQGPVVRLFMEEQIDFQPQPAAEPIGTSADGAGTVQPTALDGVLSIEELAGRFNVSTKTISRWRAHGLVARSHDVGGRKRVGFLAADVERFVAKNPLRIERGSRFSQLSTEEHGKIIGWARRLGAAGACPADVHRRIASRLNRSIETIRYTIKHHDQEHPGAEVFPAADGRLRPETCERIFQLWSHGEPVEAIAKRHHRSKASIYRVILAQRAAHAMLLPLDCIPNALFDRRSAEEVVNQPFPGLDEPSKRVRRPTGLPAYLASLYEVPLLTREQEVWLFRKFNFLKHRAKKLRDQLDPEKPSTRLMDQIDAIYLEIVALKNRLVRSNLRLVVSIAKRRVAPGDSFFDLVSDGNMSLIRAVEKFDYARGNKFSTYASWAIMKNYSRTIPDEHKRRDRFRAADMEMLQTAADPRTDENQLRMAESDRLQQVGRFLDRLDSREQTIIIRRYGLDRGLEPQTLKEVGSALGVTKERVRQIEAKALEKLRVAAQAEAVLPELE